MLQKLRKVLRSLIGGKINPGDDALKNFLFTWNCDGVTGNQLRNLFGSQSIKLIALQYLYCKIQGSYSNHILITYYLCEMSFNI